jgi:TPR repeat protein
MQKKKIFSLMLLLLLSLNSFTKTIEDGENEYSKKNYEKAFQIWKPLAESGNPFAQGYLCSLFEMGEGVKKDYEKAIYWCKLAAGKNIYASQFTLGIFYANGLGVEKNNKIAVDYFRKSALLGFNRAQYNLGLSYFHGNGVPKNLIESLKWLRVAKDNGYEPAKDVYENILQSMKPKEVAEALILAEDCTSSKYKKCK